MSFLVVKIVSASRVSLNSIKSSLIHFNRLLPSVRAISVRSDKLIVLLDLLVKNHILSNSSTLFVSIKGRIKSSLLRRAEVTSTSIFSLGYTGLSLSLNLVNLRSLHVLCIK